MGYFRISPDRELVAYWQPSGGWKRVFEYSRYRKSWDPRDYDDAPPLIDEYIMKSWSQASTREVAELVDDHVLAPNFRSWEEEADPDDVEDVKKYRQVVLEEAINLTTGDRNATHGEPIENFSNIASLWNIVFQKKLKDSEEFTPGDVARALIQVKQARMIHNVKKDDWVDTAGYTGTGYEVDKLTGLVE